MKLKNLLTLLLLICFSISFAQKDKRCKCPKNEFINDKYGTIFDLSNGLKLLVCGSVNNDTEPPTYSEFIIAECGKKAPIDFWNDTKTCEIRFANDTLYVRQMMDFPVGKNFKEQQTTWGTEKIYYTADQLVRKLYINKSIKKYTPAQCDFVNKAFETLKPGEMNDRRMELANKLFIAAISGNEKARKYLYDFKIKFKLDDESEFIDQYNDILARIDLWDASIIRR